MSHLLRLLLRVYPIRYRQRFGPEIEAQALEECQEAAGRGFFSWMWCVAATAVDVLRTGLQERWDPTWVADATGGDRHRGVGMMMGDWMRDLAYAARALRRSPGFTVAAVGTLALALGANAGIFAVVNDVLLEPLPYEHADRIVEIAASAPGSDMPEEFGVSIEFYKSYSEQANLLEGLATYSYFTNTLRAGDRVERLPMSVPSFSLFEVLGAEPVLGRLPRPEEFGEAAVISHGLWTTWFANDPEVIGQSYEMMGEPRTVVGVMGPDFAFPSDDVVLWVPRDFTFEEVTPGRFGMPLVGRMAPGADPDALRAQLATIASRLPEEYGGSSRYARLMEQHVPVVLPLKESMVGGLSTALWVLLGAVAVVLLIACANVANLFAVRAEGRGRELAVRRAMGADRGALVRTQLTESVLIAAVAGVLAIPLAGLVLPALVAAAPEGLPRLSSAGLSLRTVGFTLLLSAAAALACGLLPAFRMSAPDLSRLRDGGRGSTRRRHWGRDALVVGQTALALVLLVGSGLLMRSFMELRAVDPGYDPTDVFTFQFAPEEAHLTDGPTWAGFHVQFMDRLRALRGVEWVGIVENVPLDEGLRTAVIMGPGMSPDDGPQAGVTFAGGDYFQTMGISVLEGRPFTDRDALEPGSVVVSQALADALFPGESALGRTLTNNMLSEPHTIVGVVEDILQYDFRDTPDPMVYYPLAGPTPTSWRLTSPGYVVKTARGEGIAPEVRALIREVAPSAPMYRTYTMDGLVERSMVRLSFTMLTLGIAAALALILGSLGLYGVLSYVVAERTQEIGVRMALGAQASRVRRMVVGQGARVVLLGVALGLGAAFLATRVLGTLLYGVQAVDSWTFVGMSLAMVLVGVLASYVPARRASLVDPAESMRRS